jgi:hypothetical protein
MERQREDGAGYLASAGERASPGPSSPDERGQNVAAGGFAGERERSRERGNGVSFRSLARSSVFIFNDFFEWKGVTAFATVHVARRVASKSGPQVGTGSTYAGLHFSGGVEERPSGIWCGGLVSVRPTSAWPKITLPSVGTQICLARNFFIFFINRPPLKQFSTKASWSPKCTTGLHPYWHSFYTCEPSLVTMEYRAPTSLAPYMCTRAFTGSSSLSHSYKTLSSKILPLPQSHLLTPPDLISLRESIP